MQDQLENYLQKLRTAFKKKELSQEEVLKAGKPALWKEHELAHALYAALCKQTGLTVLPLALEPLESGAIPLFKQGSYPWGALPYPQEHAELGALCSYLGEQNYAESIRRWQKTFALTHDSKPLYALFAQERAISSKELEEANASLFATVEKVPSTGIFIDREVGLGCARGKDFTVLCAGSGCKSGLGSFLFKEAGILNFGPQSFPLGECEEFGIAGKPHFFTHEAKKEGFAIEFQTQLSGKHSRITPLKKLKDAGYSGLWIHAKAVFEEEKLVFTSEIEGTRPLDKRFFSFFGKGVSCVVAGSHKLHPRSLDRYQGPPQKVALQGKEGKVFLESLEGIEKMEVIPLAGDECYWGADFLIAFTLGSSHQSFTLSFEPSKG